METTLQQGQPNSVELFVDWLMVGLQSFGGGSSTFTLIHRLAMKRGWLSEDEFVRSWALAQIAPGINLVKLTVMLGYRLHGWLGVLVAVSGLLLPSAMVTVLMTAEFATIRNVSWLQPMMKGILPAAIGLSLAMSVQMALPLFVRARKEGRVRLGAHLFILTSAALLLAFVKLSPVIILFLSGGAAILLFVIIPVQNQNESAEEP